MVLACSSAHGFGLLKCPRFWPAQVPMVLACSSAHGFGLLKCPWFWPAQVPTVLACSSAHGFGLLKCPWFWPAQVPTVLPCSSAYPPARWSAAVLWPSALIQRVSGSVGSVCGRWPRLLGCWPASTPTVHARATCWTAIRQSAMHADTQARAHACMHARTHACTMRTRTGARTTADDEHICNPTLTPVKIYKPSFLILTPVPWCSTCMLAATHILLPA